MMKYGYSIANWLDESTYPDPERITDPQMAWEYIRRNPKYLKDFETWGKSTSVETRLSLYKKWFRDRGIYTMIDFLDNKPWNLEFRLKKRPDIFWPIDFGKEDEIVLPFLYKNDVVVVFNLDQPIPKQTHIIREALENEQEKRGIETVDHSPNRSAHRLYWRLLDAASLKVSHKKIAENVPSGDAESIKGQLREARRYRDSDYRNFLS